MFTRLLLLFSLLIVVLPLPTQGQAMSCPDPTQSWQERASDDMDIDVAGLTEGEPQIAETLPFLRSLLVVRHGCLVYERYFADASADTLFNSYSVTKSVTATLIGMAIDEGKIGSVHDEMATYITATVPPADRRISIDNLLKMLSGIGWNEDDPKDITGMLELKRDEVAYILSLPLSHRPGTFWNYSTADSHLLSAIMTGASGETELAYATPRLFAPLGIANVRWTQDANGFNLGGTQLFWQARDMAKFGLLYLHGGIWNDKIVLSKDWIDYVTTPQLADPTIYTLAYGAHWWIVSLPDYPRMFAAVGYGGQYIIVAPQQDMVIVTTANSYIQPPNLYISGLEATRQQEAILDYVATFILPSIST